MMITIFKLAYAVAVILFAIEWLAFQRALNKKRAMKLADRLAMIDEMKVRIHE